MIIKKCFCGKEFKTTPSKIKEGRGKYCSVSCMRVDHRKNISLNCCLECGKNFKVKGKKSRASRKFCSRKCMGIGKGGKNHYHWQGGPVERACLRCGKKFNPGVVNVKKNRGKFCSLKCNNIYNARRGPDNPSWKGGITPTVETIRRSDIYLRWRQGVLIRDNFSCQECGQLGGVLHAHHIKRFSEIIDDIRHNLPLIPLYEAAMIYGPLWDIGNGITLCERCHSKTRRQHGQ